MKRTHGNLLITVEPKKQSNPFFRRNLKWPFHCATLLRILRCLLSLVGSTESYLFTMQFLMLIESFA